MALEDLNNRQQEAVRTTEGPLLILAGAGSGKTSTMTHRIAYMVEQGVDPYHILAVTFTNKAANEMRSRVEDLIGRIGPMWIMTFHAMCLRILRIDAEKAGYDPNFVIYDTQDQKTAVRNILKSSGISDKEYKPQYLLSVISGCKEREQDSEQFREVNPETPRAKAIYTVYSAYEKLLRENNAMDFDDLLLNAVKLLKSNAEVREKYQERFQYIMVDEYQDTNHIQYELVKILADKYRNLCVVGDDDQCIYEWRGADIRNILDFEKDFKEAKVIKLEQNYRSTGNILDAAYSVIHNNKGRKSKRLWTEKEAGEKIRYYRADSDREEADYTARQIGQMVRNGRSYDDFAILYRTNAQSRLFEEALSRAGIPYQVLSGMRYYDRKEIKDALAYMRLVVNPADDLSLLRIINEPKRGVGPKTIEKTQAFAQVRGQSLFEALADPDGEVLESLPGRSYDKVKELVETVKACQEGMDGASVSKIFDVLLTRTGYLPSLQSERTVEAESRIENLMEFKSVIAEYEKTAENPTMQEFMAQMALAADVDQYDESEENVTLMTLHSAKGLEFPVVFLPGMEDGLFPGTRAFDSEADMEEERRLCYVGMTRAKEILFLSSAEVRTRYGRTEYTKESQFLSEIDRKVMTGDAVYDSHKKSGFGLDTGNMDGYRTRPQKPFRKSALKPIDALSYAQQETAKTAEAPNLKAGDKIEHKKFGQGFVIDVKGQIATIMFDTVGVKKVALGIAPIRKIG
ncbi:MAG: UvrD-helicase domain-containing protein [Eubacteriales bacterium]|nr:UvrD-helicase domain-containing protein [Eubacteriales bacterium]